MPTSRWAPGHRDPQVPLAPIGLARREAVGGDNRHAESGGHEATDDGQVVGLEG